jgi:hypothetical protein
LSHEREKKKPEPKGEEMQRNVENKYITAVTMKNGVFWDVTPCGYCKNGHFGRT